MAGLPKSWMFWNRFDKTNSLRILNSRIGKSYARWAAVGAGIGAVRGIGDNIVGEDRVSVLGGMIQGAMLGAAARGARSMWSGDISSRAARLRRLRTARGTRMNRTSMGSAGWGVPGDIY